MDWQQHESDNFLWLTRKVVKEIFKVSLLSYFIFYIIENINIGYISDYFNINILLIITIISGIVTAAFRDESVKDAMRPMKKWDYIFILLMGIASALIVYYRISEIGKLAYLISIVSGVIIILISISLINEQVNNKKNH